MYSHRLREATGRTRSRRAALLYTDARPDAYKRTSAKRSLVLLFGIGSNRSRKNPREFGGYLRRRVHGLNLRSTNTFVQLKSP
ncbi:hypothetical protein GWI33_004525 [Rhynchophorus ferrugineus]|uniref:Uncharacterized protein n=1 Tax=Rhynchophorus ferrugineus TaxID=354439 RepID=A0A834IM46_RHYFE|nr:hypothetical protein GWI33_004525 [Rhynchophorus ferrugineus]